MYSQNDISGVHSLIAHTGEGNLRKMLVDASFTETHLKMMIKLSKSMKESAFIDCFNAENFGAYRLGPAEKKIAETFWAVSKKRLSQVGLLGLSQAKAA